MPRQQPLASPVPIGAPQCCLWTGSERYGRRSDRIPPPEEPSESPRHFAASMDESVIVGYYTLKKCLSVAPRCLQIPKKGQKIYGKK